MNLKDSKQSVASHLHQIIKLEDNSYKGITSWPISTLFFFTVTPKGKDKQFADYLQSFKESIYLVKPLNFAYYVKECENTDHLHGIISIKVPNYKFKKIRNDIFDFRATKLNSLWAATKYMSKGNPTHLYKLQVVKFHTRVTYDGRGGNPKGEGLQKRNMYHEIKLNLV